METNHEALKKALEEHVLDSHGNIYTITVDDVLGYINELIKKHPDLAEKIDTLNQVSLATEIADFIGGVGIVDHIEMAISEAVYLQIECEPETTTEVCDG
jgi:hypothetical protein